MSHYLEQNGDDLWLDGPPVYFCFGPQQAGESVLAVISWDSWGRTLDLICATCCFLIIFVPGHTLRLFLKIKNGWRHVFWHRQHDPVAIRDCHMQVVTAGLLWSELNFARVQRMFPRQTIVTGRLTWRDDQVMFLFFAGGAAELFDCTRSHLSFHPLQRQTHHYAYIEK